MIQVLVPGSIPKFLSFFIAEALEFRAPGHRVIEGPDEFFLRRSVVLESPQGDEARVGRHGGKGNVNSTP